eukprot:6982324-Prymnesium_polylepis.1
MFDIKTVKPAALRSVHSGRRGIVCTRLAPQPTRTPIASSHNHIIVRRAQVQRDIAWLQLLWSSGGHYLSPPRAT